MAESVSDWLPAIRTGDARATRNVWQRYFRRLIGLARRQLGGLPRAVSDEEDVAIQALHSFFRRARSGAFSQLENRDDLWRVLACITRRKAANERRHWRSDRRAATGGHERRSRLRLESPSETATAEPLDQPWYASFQTPESLVALEETRQQMLALIDDDELHAIAEAKLDGYTNVEIAAHIQRSVPTVERRVRLIRRLWERQGLAQR